MTAAEWMFWGSLGAALYAYAGYPLVLYVAAALWGRRIPLNDVGADLPGVTMIVPAADEIRTIADKVRNTRELRYPADKLQVVYVSDGSVDGTAESISQHLDAGTSLVRLETRQGKAAALNAGLSRATNEIVVFTDASIRLDPDALLQIVRPFADPRVGCVSGEDYIRGAEGEGLYGRYELALRRQEARLSSILGASGSFYAQRRSVCEPFQPGLAPDFLSVLVTVRKGYRAVAHAGARGWMSAVPDAQAEYRRKVRTILRGITTLGANLPLLNPWRFGWFSFQLASHKLCRWLVPFFLTLFAISSVMLAPAGSWYRMFLVLELALAVILLATVVRGPARVWRPLRLLLYLASVNVATAAAWAKYIGGTRQEVWSPSRR